jgi:simple sugar transport system permease protein
MTTAPATAESKEQAIQRAARQERILNVVLPFFAVLASFLVGSIFLMVLGINPIEAYTALLQGAFGTARLTTTTIIKSVPLILAGLAVVLAYRGGVFNIGAEGQLYLGALFAVVPEPCGYYPIPCT